MPNFHMVLYCLDELTHFSSVIGRSFRVQHILCEWADVWANVAREKSSLHTEALRAQWKFTRALPKCVNSSRSYSNNNFMCTSHLATVLDCYFVIGFSSIFDGLFFWIKSELFFQRHFAEKWRAWKPPSKPYPCRWRHLALQSRRRRNHNHPQRQQHFRLIQQPQGKPLSWTRNVF